MTTGGILAIERFLIPRKEIVMAFASKAIEDKVRAAKEKGMIYNEREDSFIPCDYGVSGVTGHNSDTTFRWSQVSTQNKCLIIAGIIIAVALLVFLAYMSR